MSSPSVPRPSCPYFAYIEEKDETDAITLEELDKSHPRKVITLYNGFSPDTKEDYELSCFNTLSIIEMISRGKQFNPITRIPFDKNQLKRIEWYKHCLDMFPEINTEDILDYKKLLSEWLKSPLEENIATNMARFFTIYNQVINFFGFNDIDSREKAEEYLRLNPDKTWVIRKSSVKDTRYNQFFVIMTKTTNPEYPFKNYLFVHRQGYGICDVDATRNADIASVSLMTSYYTNVVDLLISYAKKGIISL